MTKDIFISYRRKIDGIDNDKAELIKEYLKKYNIHVFFDKHDMKNGNFEENLKKNIRECSNFLILLTKNIFARKKEGDILREEIKYAVKLKKNIIPIMFDDYDLDADLSDEEPEISSLKTYDILCFNNSNPSFIEATTTGIINRMIDENGKPFNPSKTKRNDYYTYNELSDEDKLWITSYIDVCKDINNEIFLSIIQEPCLIEKNEINIFCPEVYDIEAYKKKYDDICIYINKKLNKNYKFNIYGFCHDYFFQQACVTFGENHFADCFDEKNLIDEIKKIAKNFNIDGFDIIDTSLYLKDLSKPEKTLADFSGCLSQDGGIIYVMELDDDFAIAYEDRDGYIEKLLNLLKLDDAAGNRHIGRRIYTFLKKIANKVYISDKVISTANKKPQFRKNLFNSYFSYLKPEMEVMRINNPDNDDYKDACNWLDRNYSEIESKFSSSEFYFRAGFIFGYGVFFD